MEAPITWTDTYRVHSYHSDRFGNLRLSNIAGFLQESAWAHSNACGIGYKDLKEIGKLWILSGITIKILNSPRWGDTITMNTWGNDYVDPFAYRDFELLDESGNQLICGSTGWLLVNESNHRPNRISPEYQKIPARNTGSGSGKPSRIAEIEPGGQGKSRIVNFSDIDIYQHVNNAEYIEFCVDLLPASVWEVAEAGQLTVNYLGETLPENVLKIRMVEKNKLQFFFTAFNETTGKEVMRAEFLFRKRRTR